MREQDIRWLYAAQVFVTICKIVAGFYTMILIALTLMFGMIFCGVAYGQLAPLMAFLGSMILILCANMVCGRLLKVINVIDVGKRVMQKRLAEWSNEG